MKDLLLIYRLEGETAQRLFDKCPEEAERSGIEDPASGLGVKLSAHLDEMEVLSGALKASVRLFVDGDVEELRVHKENFDLFEGYLIKMLGATTALRAYMDKEVPDATV